MAGMLTARSSGLSGADGTAESVTMTGSSGFAGTGIVHAVNVINLTAFATYLTLDGTTPVAAAAGTWCVPGVAGYVKTIPLPVVASYDDAANQPPIIVKAISSAGAWSLWLEVF